MADVTRYTIDMTAPEIAAVLSRNPLVVLPCGSVEQHGPHLPTGTDYYAAVAIGDAVARRLDALLLPSCPVGVTPMHMPFAGTLSLEPETYARVVEEIVLSARSHGARQVLLMNWHEGNIPALSIAAERLARTHGMTVVAVQACYVAEEMFGREAGGLSHGGEIEAWSVLCYRPELVHLERAAGGSDWVRGAAMDRLRRTASYQPVLPDVRAIAPTGWYGDPTPATQEKADRFLQRIADEIADRAREMLAELETLRRRTEGA